MTDQDTNSLLTYDANSEILSNMAMYVAPPGGQSSNKLKVVTCWPNLQPISQLMAGVPLAMFVVGFMLVG